MLTIDISKESIYHVPVMRAEAIEWLSVRRGGVYVDATLGGGGYAEAILERCTPGGKLFGIDRDVDALVEARARLSSYGDSFVALHGNFAGLGRLLDGSETVEGIVFDLGVSSHQLDERGRGFSFRGDADLDMRMDRSQGPTAGDLIADLPERELTRILRDNGDEKWAARIARFIVDARSRSPIRTTGELVRVIEAAVPKAARPKEIHAATRTFQALRITVNDELGALEAGLDTALKCLAPGDGLSPLATIL